MGGWRDGPLLSACLTNVEAWLCFPRTHIKCWVQKCLLVMPTMVRWDAKTGRSAELTGQLAWNAWWNSRLVRDPCVSKNRTHLQNDTGGCPLSSTYACTPVHTCTYAKETIYTPSSTSEAFIIGVCNSFFLEALGCINPWHNYQSGTVLL